MASSDVPGPGQFTFVRKEDRGGNDGGNMAAAFARKALRDEYSKADGQLLSDFESVLRGEAIYLPNFHCAKRDYALLAGLAKDMEEHESASEGGGMINWSKHLKHENPEFSETFKRVTDAMAAHFDVEIYATRLNFYRDGTDWKPFHHDSHAYGGREKREDFTMGASFGSERELTFLHEPSGQQFSFPQRNGDVFAFTTEVNKRFKHGVPKLTRGPAVPDSPSSRGDVDEHSTPTTEARKAASSEAPKTTSTTRRPETPRRSPRCQRRPARARATTSSWVPAKSPSSSARFCAMRRRAIRENARARSGPGGRVGRSRGCGRSRGERRRRRRGFPKRLRRGETNASGRRRPGDARERARRGETSRGVGRLGVRRAARRGAFVSARRDGRARVLRRGDGGVRRIRRRDGGGAGGALAGPEQTRGVVRRARANARAGVEWWWGGTGWERKDSRTRRGCETRHTLVLAGCEMRRA